MKTEKFVLLLVILLLGAITVFGQGRRYAGRPGYGYGNGYGYGYGYGNGYGNGYGYGYGYGNDYGYGPGSFVMFLSDLTEDQKAKMIELETNHQKEIVEWRIKQRSTFDPEEKIAIWGEMQQKVLAHRSEVRNLLTEEQQIRYNLLHAGTFYGRGRFAPGCRGRGGRAAFGRRGGFGGFRGGGW